MRSAQTPQINAILPREPAKARSEVVRRWIGLSALPTMNKNGIASATKATFSGERLDTMPLKLISAWVSVLLFGAKDLSGLPR